MKKNEKNFVWVVKIKEDGHTWLPCEACGIDYNGGRLRMSVWKEDNPDDKFRVKKYISEE